MTMVKEMLATYPADLGRVDREKLRACIEACVSTSQTCTACADACLSENVVEDLTRCIRTDLDCADICQTTANVLSRHTGFDANVTRAIVGACAVACAACADECGQHTEHEHCRVCAEACRNCRRACDELLSSLI